MASSIVVWQAQLQVWQAQLQGTVRNRPGLPGLREYYLQMACGGLQAVASRISTQQDTGKKHYILLMTGVRLLMAPTAPSFATRSTLSILNGPSIAADGLELAGRTRPTPMDG